MDKKKLLGREGEAEAAEFLKKKGFDIVGMNYSCRQGEIDVIARDSQYIVFAEVKLRKSAAFAEAKEFVNYSKQQKVKSAALLWLSQNDTDLQPRFDVIEIYTSGAQRGINHIENAFD